MNKPPDDTTATLPVKERTDEERSLEGINADYKEKFGFHDPEGVKIGVFNCGGALHAIEDRCSHDDGPLAEGEFDAEACTVECPRHGSLFDLSTGKPKTLPAYVPVRTFEVTVEDDTVKLEVS